MGFDIQADYDHCKTAADYIKSKITLTPELGIVLGSGLGPLADMIEVDAKIDYNDIPCFPRTTVSSHKGCLIIGTLAGVKVVCMQGRFHYYEGYSFEQLAMPVRVLSLLGIKAMFLTNAAGGVNLSYKPGDIMLIADHLNLLGINPVRGQSYSEFGDRFYDVQNLYTESFRKIARKCAKRSELAVHEGTYMFFPGPNFETPAEIRAVRLLGADAVGMSTVPEALTAGHIGLPVIGFSVITNYAAGMSKEPLSDDDVRKIADSISNEFSAYVRDVISSIGPMLAENN